MSGPGLGGGENASSALKAPGCSRSLLSCPRPLLTLRFTPLGPHAPLSLTPPDPPSLRCCMGQGRGAHSVSPPLLFSTRPCWSRGSWWTSAPFLALGSVFDLGTSCPRLPAGGPGGASPPQPLHGACGGGLTSLTVVSTHGKVGGQVGSRRGAAGGVPSWTSSAGTAPRDGGRRERERITCEPRQGPWEGQMRASECSHTVSRLHRPSCSCVARVPAHTHTWSHVCTGAHTGLKSWHIPGS